VANPLHRTLTADTELRLPLDGNYGKVEVALVANAATTYFNTSDTPIGAVAGNMDGNHVVTSVVPTRIVLDATAGANSVVRVRSAGTPTITVTGL
jgi:hypothetical protein